MQQFLSLCCQGAIQLKATVLEKKDSEARKFCGYSKQSLDPERLSEERLKFNAIPEQQKLVCYHWHILQKSSGCANNLKIDMLL